MGIGSRESEPTPNPSQEGNGNRESGIGNRNPPLTPPRRGTGIGNRELGIGSRESGIGNWDRKNYEIDNKELDNNIFGVMLNQYFVS
ncbi:MAG: hypothetical protein F6J90_28515 [Moorea sp. SIOASIH]|uniref:hypothetical protein n=1 Tax=Moorena sp. SIOASIH TaxID=2607817 RepID=UPI0013BB60E6|nr:hypothetical protein [Moorena sp. SIOASIH]NEO40067.1 hypothetical protein [Moorena sp. SIOASIH]